MANFSPIFQGQNYSLNFSSGTFHVPKDIYCLLQVSIPPKIEYFTRKMSGCYIVVWRPCNDIGWDSRYLEYSTFRIILKRTECFSLTNLLSFLR